MRKRNVEILFRMTRREAQEMDKKVKMCIRDRFRVIGKGYIFKFNAVFRRFLRHIRLFQGLFPDNVHNPVHRIIRLHRIFTGQHNLIHHGHAHRREQDINCLLYTSSAVDRTAPISSGIKWENAVSTNVQSDMIVVVKSAR